MLETPMPQQFLEFRNTLESMRAYGSLTTVRAAFPGKADFSFWRPA
jgi:hypothetical protein